MAVLRVPQIRSTQIGSTQIRSTVDPSRIDVIRSPRRRRGASAGVRDGRVVVRLPAGLAPAGEAELVASLLQRLATRAEAVDPEAPVPGLPDEVAMRATRGPRGPRGDRQLVERADAVAARWLPQAWPTDVRWSHRMHSRWASCSLATARIRVSSRLADAPDPVLDHILLHELAHLIVPHHGPAFRALLAPDPSGPAVDRWLSRRSALELRDVLGQSGIT